MELAPAGLSADAFGEERNIKVLHALRLLHNSLNTLFTQSRSHLVLVSVLVLVNRRRPGAMDGGSSLNGAKSAPRYAAPVPALSSYVL